ncbi:MAG: DUF2927 domain-containing protein [Alphaproteobacteria bacterium]
MALLLSLRVDAAEALPSAEVIVEAFRQVVFRTEGGEGVQGKPLVRWAGPVSASMDGDAAAIATHRADIVTLFKELSTLTGLKFALVVPGQPTNLRIHFMPTAEIRRVAGLPAINCFGRFQGSKENFVAMAGNVYISTDSEQKTRHCIPEEITQVLGLPNDTTLIPGSLFNDDNTTLRGLSLSDKILLRALYDRRLRPGMSASEAMPIARVVITELHARIADAQKKGILAPSK